mgnify:CR=1
MRWTPAFLLLLTLLLPGCGKNKPKAVNDVENAAAEKAKRIENFASDRLNVDKQ